MEGLVEEIDVSLTAFICNRTFFESQSAFLRILTMECRYLLPSLGELRLRRRSFRSAQDLVPDHRPLRDAGTHG